MKMKKFGYKATAVSPANIAFIKFWGKRNPLLNIPFNNSISMNLSNCLTITTVEFNSNFLDDSVSVDGKEVLDSKKDRVVKILNLVRKKSKIDLKAKVVSQNNFPQGAGIASSASAFSALALASSEAAGFSLPQKQLSILARRGSGSACRSIIDGFSEWKAGASDKTSYSIQIAKLDYWGLRDVVVVVDQKEKKVGSTEGHELATSSPYFRPRLKLLPARIGKIKKAFFNKDFEKFGKIIEEEAVDLHIMAMASDPPVYYWNEGTMEIVKAVQEWRESGLSVYFTIDAGPNVHLICLKKDAKKVSDEAKKLKKVAFTIINEPCRGTHLIDKHLF